MDEMTDHEVGNWVVPGMAGKEGNQGSWRSKTASTPLIHADRWRLHNNQASVAWLDQLTLSTHQSPST